MDGSPSPILVLDHPIRRSELERLVRGGANYHPRRGAEDCLEYTSLINIRPSQGNRSMELADPELRRRVRELVSRLVGTGEEESWPPSTPD